MRQLRELPNSLDRDFTGIRHIDRRQKARVRGAEEGIGLREHRVECPCDDLRKTTPKFKG
jgi:hypothetical protein